MYFDFAAIKASISIEDGAQRLGLELKPEGQAFRCNCPACGGSNTRDIILTPSKKAFFCFQAQKGGDVISLVAHIKGVSMKEAAQFLAEPSTVKAPSTSSQE